MGKFLTGAVLGVLLIVPPAFSGGIALLKPLVSDNGDEDGFADTKETVTVRFRVQNTTEGTLNGVALHLTTKDHALICVTNVTIEVGNLLAGEIRETTEGLQFVVTDVDRSTLGFGPYADLSVGFDVTATADPPDGNPPVHPSRLRLDLDLDVSGSTTQATFFESFENGMGTFEVDNLDQGIYDLATSDGYRCQYHDPDWINSDTFGDPLLSEECYLNVSPQHAEAVWWSVSGPTTSPLGGRGFSGLHSLFYGTDMGPPMNWTTPLGTLESAITIDPIPLAWDVAPLLTFKHQASLVDGRAGDLIEGAEGGAGAFDRGVVMVQVADDQGSPSGTWFKLDPYINVYDQVATQAFTNCMFDPIDDGSTEDTFFDPQDPSRKYGPSATCFPEHTFANMGDSDKPFDPDHVGMADGPGLEGVWGIGTWVESKFDLSRFRGRSIRVRLLVSAMQILPNLDWEEYLDWNPNAGDNGWWIDDVTISGALATAASVSADLTDNSGLPGPPAGQDPDTDSVCAVGDNCPGIGNPDQLDGDSDGAGAACDCNDLVAAVYPGAVETNDGLDNQCSGEPGNGLVDEISGMIGYFQPGNKNAISWPAQPGAVRYQAARATSANFADCTAFPLLLSPVLIDSTPVSPGTAHFYLVRAFYPNVGSWGADSAGHEKILPCGE